MTDKEHLNSLTKGQKRFLRRFGCAWCDHPLSMTGCSVIYGEKCSDEKRIKRREDCLKNYKPRNKK